MATSLLALLDDIASVLDDVSILTKVAAKKTAGVLGDDLALNAEQVTGVKADRELPVVWAVAKGSLVNKVILVPSALLISALLPWAVTILLMIGGLFLCFEGAEKLAHRFIHRGEDDREQREQRIKALADRSVDMVAFEKDKVRGAIRTDFILSAEIIVITLGIVAGSPLPTRIAVLAGIALLMTVGVYGLVAGIVKLDDLGIALSRHGGARATVGRALLLIAPRLMKFLSIAGTAAMFLVGGGILSHNIPWLHHLSEGFGAALAGVPAVGAALAAIGPTLFDAVVGLAAGFVVVAVLSQGKKLFARPRAPAGGH
jgi:predicted DNA repair protein MutK